jgi:drug/metabolite transporter (DMT)-like permease
MCSLATRAKLSNAVIMSLFACTSFVTAVAFYIIYDEKLTGKHLIGMVSMVISTVLIAFSDDVIMTKYDIGHQDKNFLQEASKIIPISLAMLNCILFTINSLITRELAIRGMPTQQITADVLFIYSALMGIALIYEHYWIRPYLFIEIYPIALCTCIGTIGFILITFAFIHGKAGPS